MTGRRVLVCGGRDYADRDRLRSVLDGLKLGLEDLVITGAARGADRLAEEWAKYQGVPRVIFPANWTGEGKPAGAIRNQRMLDVAAPDLVVAFPGGRGTKNMIYRARRAGVRVIEIAEGGNEDLL